ncbi:hypothetical protein JB92DRAFT_3112725 [Gautieria morchelliformis]|nr:hypothetical protein JB92DRAFT_3112725 [Gautieria morchelliformis]
MAKTAYFAKSSPSALSSSVLPTLTVQGDLLAGAVTRTVVGTILNPLTTLKAHYESDSLCIPKLMAGILFGCTWWPITSLPWRNRLCHA